MTEHQVGVVVDRYDRLVRFAGQRSPIDCARDVVQDAIADLLEVDTDRFADGLLVKCLINKIRDRATKHRGAMLRHQRLERDIQPLLPLADQSYWDALDWMEEFDLAQRVGRINARKTMCPSGHPYTADNTTINACGHRVCKTCQRERSARRRAERRRLNNMNGGRHVHGMVQQG